MLRALDKDGVTSQTILNTKNALYELKQVKRAVTLKWIKAHIGIDGNELADEYAKLGATAEHNTQNLPITKNEINKRIEENAQICGKASGDTTSIVGKQKTSIQNLVKQYIKKPINYLDLVYLH